MEGKFIYIIQRILPSTAGEVDVQASFPLSRFGGDGKKVNINFSIGGADSPSRVGIFILYYLHYIHNVDATISILF